MTQTSTTHCPGTEALADEQAIEIIGDAETYRRWYGRKMCATCHGAVLRTSKGIRKHVPHSNLTAEEIARFGV